jgi:UDP-N-acetylmuramoyl-L-alanyl-D-glutamate--2,6-diaminopimelate ligase
MRAYFLAKKRLFTGLDGSVPRILVLNADDPHFEELQAIAPQRVISYGMDARSDIHPIRYAFDRNNNEWEGDFQSPAGVLRLRSRLLGKPNLYNIAAAAGVAVGLGLPVEAISTGIERRENVPGRFESVRAGQKFRVVVDYAHTDDALARVLEAAREITEGRLIVVFGCGGDRDRTKRPLMGKAAARGSDFAIVTSDNPRSEDPMAIIADVEPGMLDAGAAKGQTYEVIPERREAIRRALEVAAEKDTVVLAGKGHETYQTYQVIGDRSLPFDDRAVARELLDELASR